VQGFLYLFDWIRLQLLSDRFCVQEDDVTKLGESTLWKALSWFEYVWTIIFKWKSNCCINCAMMYNDVSRHHMGRSCDLRVEGFVTVKCGRALKDWGGNGAWWWSDNWICGSPYGRCGFWYDKSWINCRNSQRYDIQDFVLYVWMFIKLQVEIDWWENREL